MNKIYRVIWNKETGTWNAVSEYAKAKGKSSSSAGAGGVFSGMVFTAVRFAYTLVMSGLLIATGQVAYAVNGTEQGTDDKSCFYDTATQSVICGDATTSVTDKYDGKNAKAVALGFNAVTTGESNVALGANSTAEKTGALAIGSSAKATHNQTVAVGQTAQALGEVDISIGKSSGAATSSGRNIAIGENSLGKATDTSPTSTANNFIAIGTNAGASSKATHSVAIGTDAGKEMVTANNVSIGYQSEAGKEIGSGAATAVGYQAKANKAQSMALGYSSDAVGTHSVAVGANAQAGANFATAIGGSNTEANATTASATYSIAVGYKSKASGINTVAMGHNASAGTLGSTALGSGATTKAVGGEIKGVGAIAISGTLDNNATQQTVASGNSSIAMGVSTTATNNNAVAIGAGAKSTALDATAIGASAQARNRDSVAIGVNADTGTGVNGRKKIENGVEKNDPTGLNVAIGANAKNTDNWKRTVGADQGTYQTWESTAVGADTTTEGVRTTAVGYGAKAKEYYATAVGYKSDATGWHALAVGSQAKVSAEATTDKTESDAIYSNSKGNGTNQTGSNGLIDNILTASESAAAMAVGRQAHAAGYASIAHGLNAQATAALSTAIGANTVADSMTSMAIGSRSQAKDNGAIAIGSSIREAAGTQALAKNTIAMGNATVVDVNTELTSVHYLSNQGETATKEAGKFYVMRAPDKDKPKEKTEIPASEVTAYQNNRATAENAIALGTGAQALAKNAISVGTGNIVSGENSGAFGDPSIINGSNSYSVGNNNAIASTSDNVITIGGQNNVGAAATRGADGVIDTTKALTNTQNADRTFVMGFKNTIADKAETNDSVVLGNENTVNANNVMVLGNKIQDVTVANNVILGNESSQNSVTNKTGQANQVTDGKVNDVTYGGFAGTATGLVSVGATNKERQITNVAPGEISATSTDAINGSQLYMVTKGTLEQMPVVYTAPNGTKVTKQPDGTFKDAMGNNYNPADVIASMNNGNGTTTTPTTLANVAGNLNGAKAGTTAPTTKGELIAGVNNNNAATVGDVLNAGFNLQQGTTDKDFVKAYDTISFVDGNATTATVTTNGTNDRSEIKFDIKTDGTTIKVEGGQLKANTAPLSVTNGVVDAPATTATAPDTVAPANKLVTAGDVATAINSVGFKLNSVAGEGELGKNSTSNELIKAGDTVTLEADKNIKLTQTNGKVEIATKDDVEFKTINLKDGTNETKLATTANGLDVDGDKITNVADGTIGTGSKDAINGGQLFATNQNVETNKANIQANKAEIDRGLNFGANDQTDTNGQPINRKLGQTINVKGGITDTNKATSGENVITRTDTNGNINIELAKDAKFDSVTTGEAKLDNTGLSFVDGAGTAIANSPSITKTGINAGNQVIAGVKTGVADTDAVNVAQLRQYQTDNEKTTTVKAGNNVTVSEKVDGNNTEYTVNAEKTTLSNTTATKVTAGTKGANGVTNYEVDLSDASKASLAKADTAVQSIKVKANGNDVTTLNQNNDTLDITQGDNITVSNDSGKVKVALNKDVAGLDSLTSKTVTAGTGASQVVLDDKGVNVGGNTYISDTGLNANGKKVTGVANGDINAGSKDAINGGQLADEIGKLNKSITAAKTHLKAGDNTTLAGDGTAANPYKVNVATTSATVARGNVTVADADKNKFLTAGDVAKAINDSEKTSSVTHGSDAVTVTAGKEDGNGNTLYTVDVSGKTKASLAKADSAVQNVVSNNPNLTTTKAGDIATLDFSDNPEFASVKTGNATLTNNGLTIANADPKKVVSLTNDGLNNGGNKITNVANGTADTDAVNVSQLNAVKDIAGVKTKVSAGNGIAVTNTGTTEAPNYKVDVKTDNATIKVSNDGNLTANTTTLTNANGKVSTPTESTALVTAQTVANAINNSGFNLQANGDTASLVKAGDKVQFLNGDNIEISRKGNDITVATKKDVEFKTINLKDGTNETKLTTTANGLNVGGDRITNLASGLNGKNLSDIKADLEAGKTVAEASNAATIGDLATVQNTVTNNITNNITNINNVLGVDTNATKPQEVKAGDILGNNANASEALIDTKDVLKDANGKPILTTYNVAGQTEYIQNDVVKAINHMNDQGIKFFHTNDGTVKPEDQAKNKIDSSASGAYATAIGYQTVAQGDNAVAMGNTYTTATLDESRKGQAVISEVKDDNGNVVAYAQRTQSTGKNAVAIGTGSQALQENTIAIGTGNVVNAKNSGAIGDPNIVFKDATGSYVIGNNNEIRTADTYALGSEIKATVGNSVFLGNESSSNGVHTTADGGNYTFAGVNDQNVAGGSADKSGKAPVGVVSVGTEGGQTRQIQNVSAGVVSATSTDAINGSQLYYTNEAIAKVGNQLNNRIDDVADEANAGISSAMAMASLPQAYLPGKSMLTGGVASYNGEGAVAVGLSKLSDNGRWVLKISGSADTQGNAGGAVGAGFHF